MNGWRNSRLIGRHGLDWYRLKSKCAKLCKVNHYRGLTNHARKLKARNPRIEIKRRLREIEGIDELTDEIRSESDGLQGELKDVETRRAAALATEPDPEGRIVEVVEDSEYRERREIRKRTGLRDYLIAACSGSPVGGAAAELNASCGVLAGDHVPRELFDGPARELRQAEHRAVTPGPAVDAAPMASVFRTSSRRRRLPR